MRGMRRARPNGRMRKHALAVLLALMCTVSMLCTACGNVEDGGQEGQIQTDSVSAVTMRMEKTEGTVKVQDEDGGEVAIQEPLSLYNGYGLQSQPESYAWISLDDTKLAKLDQESGASVYKDGKHLEMVTDYGSLFFHVTQALEEEETLDIRVGTLSVGIRGTCGWVRRQEKPYKRYEVYILEGNVVCGVEDTGFETSVSAGQMLYVEPDEDGSVGWKVEEFTRQDIPEYVWVELDHTQQEEVTALLAQGEGMSQEEASQGGESQESEEQTQVDPETLEPEDRIAYYMDFLEDGKEMIFAGKLSFFGREIDAIALEDLRDILVEEGLADNRLFLEPVEDLFTQLMYPGVDGVVELPIDGIQPMEAVRFTSFGWRKEYPSGTATGILDMNAGDSIETVLTKMGFTHAQEIGALLRSNSGVSVRWSSYDHGQESWSVDDLNVGDKVSDSVSISFEEWNDFMEEPVFMRLSVTAMYKTERSSSASMESVWLYFNENYELCALSISQPGD